MNEIYSQGSCVDSGKHHLFFSDRPHELAEAQAICRSCAVRLRCLELALDSGVEWGVWGGVIFLEGKPFYRRRGRGRPRQADRALPVEASAQELRELVRSA